MIQTEQQRSSTSKDGVPTTLQRKRGQTSLMDTFMGLVPTLMEMVAWRYGAVLTGVSFRIYRGKWSSVVKADFGEDPLVAYTSGWSFAHCVEATCAHAEAGLFYWQDDDYPPKERKLPLRF